MRYMSLLEMLTGVRTEARLSQAAAHGIQLRDQHTYLLNRIQDDLYLNYDWQSLRTTAYVDLDAGTRYKAYPENLDQTAIEEVFAKRNTSGEEKFYPIYMGIDPRHYNLKNSDNPVTGQDTPIRRWQNYVPSDGSTNQNMFEVWPIPNLPTTLMFRGKKKPQTLVNDNDMSSLDGPSIVLHAAAEILAGQGSEDAALKLNKAQERVRTLKVNQESDNEQINLGVPKGGYWHRRRRYGLDYME